MSRQKQFSTATRNRLSDHDMLLDLMMTEKHLSSLYDHCVLEATTPVVSDAIERLQADTHNNVHTLFIAMQQHGWSNPEQAAERLLKSNPIEAYKKFDLPSESKYAGSSGSRGSGRRVSRGQRQDSLTN